MLEQMTDLASQYMQTNPWMATAAVFLAGILTASNPCVLAMIPLMMSFVAGQSREKGGVFRAFAHSAVFVLGLSIAFTALGMIAALAGTMYGEVSTHWNWVVAAVCVLMGLHIMEVFRIPIPGLSNFLPKIKGYPGALVLGLMFGFVSAPCAGPMILLLLTYLATTNASVPYGGFLMFVYGLGHSVLILIAGTSMGAAKKLIESKKATTVMLWLRRVAGAVIVLIGFYFAYRAIW